MGAIPVILVRDDLMNSYSVAHLLGSQQRSLSSLSVLPIPKVSMAFQPFFKDLFQFSKCGATLKAYRLQPTLF